MEAEMKRSSLCRVSLLISLMLVIQLSVFGQEPRPTNMAGGRGGSPFTDTQIPSGARVSEIRIFSGDVLDSVQMVYTLPDGRTYEGARHGGGGGQMNTFRLDSDEYITGISGRFGEYLDSIQIRTNKRTSPLFGGSGGDRDYRIDVERGNQAVGFLGRSGDYLDAIGLVFTQLPRRQAFQASEANIAGGRGGSPFSDQGIPAGARISEIRIRSGRNVDSIQAVYTLQNGRIMEGPVHGGTGGNIQTFRLDSDEYIIGISGRCGDFVDSIAIETNKRKSPTFGGPGGDRNYAIAVPEGNQVIGFTGRAGGYLDAVGVNYAPVDRRFRELPGRRFGNRNR
jgi:hypothetical protein